MLAFCFVLFCFLLPCWMSVVLGLLGNYLILNFIEIKRTLRSFSLFFFVSLLTNSNMPISLFLFFSISLSSMFYVSPFSISLCTTGRVM